MGLTNREKLEIITRAKKDNYTGNYLDLFNQATAEARQKMPEVRRAGGFIYDVNKPKKSTYVDARSGYGFPTTYENGGSPTEYPPYDSLTDFQKQNITREEYAYTTAEFKIDEREFIPGPGGTLDSLAMNELSRYTERKMNPSNHVYDHTGTYGGWMGPERSQNMVNKLNDNTQGDSYRVQMQLDEDGNQIPGSEYIVQTQKGGKQIFYRGMRPDELRGSLGRLNQGYQGIMPHGKEGLGVNHPRLIRYNNMLAETTDPTERANIQAKIDRHNENEALAQQTEISLGETPNVLSNDPNKEQYNQITRVIGPDPNNPNVHIIKNEPSHSRGTKIPQYQRPVGRSIPRKTPNFEKIPMKPAGPIPTNFVEPDVQKIPVPEFPNTGPTKSDLFFEGLENANTFKNRPDTMSNRAGRNVIGKDEVSTEYIFSANNPYAPQKGEYFMSAPNSRGKRKYDGDLNAARKWERENGLGIQADLEGYNVGPDIQKHGGFSRMFKQDFSKYINKKEDGGLDNGSIKGYGHGGPHDDTAPLPIGDQQSMLDNTRVPIINLNKITSNEMPSNEVAVNPPVNERRQFINFLKEQEAGPQFMRAINSAVKKPDGTYYKAFEGGKFYPYFQGTEKEATIGYGRKAADVLEKYNQGITDQQALDFMNKDIDRSLYLAEEYVERNKESPFYGDVGSFGRLDSNTQYLLADYTYNVGKLSKFPNFTKAVLTNDPVGMEEEYIRVEDKSTNIPLKRNKPFYDLYLKPKIDKLKNNKKQEGGLNDIPTVNLPEVAIYPTTSTGQRIADIASSMEMNEEDGGREPASFDTIKDAKGLKSKGGSFNRYIRDLFNANMDKDGLCRDNTCVETVKDFYSAAGIDAIPGGVYNNREFLKNFKEYGFEEILDQKNLEPGDVIQYYYGEDSEDVREDPSYLNFPYHMGVYVSPGEYIGDGDSTAPIKRQNMYTGIKDGKKYKKDPFRAFRYIGK